MTATFVTRFAFREKESRYPPCRKPHVFEGRLRAPSSVRTVMSAPRSGAIADCDEHTRSQGTDPLGRRRRSICQYQLRCLPSLDFSRCCRMNWVVEHSYGDCERE